MPLNRREISAKAAEAGSHDTPASATCTHLMPAKAPAITAAQITKQYKKTPKIAAQRGTGCERAR
jgi:hypothetical protein